VRPWSRRSTIQPPDEGTSRVKSMLEEFKAFINKGNVVMIAVGLVMALYFKTIVDAVVEGVIMPIVAAILGETDFTQIGFGIGDAFISIGLVIQAVVVFIIVAFVLFLIVRAYNRYLVKPEEEVQADTEIDLLTQIRDELRSRS
jgi:large conductance mechanosensitive channel